MSLRDPIERNKVTELIRSAVDKYSKEALDDGHRNHLGASIIGEECERKLFYSFRWVQAPNFDGRMHRLFNRGHEEEARFIRWLKGIGCNVWEADPKTGKQFRVTHPDGHFGGSLDGIGTTPYFGGTILLEFKTASEQSFKKTKKEGVKLSQPKHFAQMCVYGKAYNLNFALYIMVNKNNDEIYYEMVELDFSYAEELIRKAEYITQTNEPPPKVSSNASSYKCRFCDYFEICHKGKALEKNCRSCAHSATITGGKWICTYKGFEQLKDFKQCEKWEPISR